MGTTITRPMTFAEFERLPEPKGAYHELRHGEMVEVPFAKHGHLRDQYQLMRLLQPAAGETGVVCLEVAYRPTPEYEGWRADVAYVSKERWYGAPRDGYLQGAPELVIEILSPSNTIPEIREKRKLCLANGSREFWVVDSDYREVEVWTPDGRSITYGVSDEIPLFFAPGSCFASTKSSPNIRCGVQLPPATVIIARNVGIAYNEGRWLTFPFATSPKRLRARYVCVPRGMAVPPRRSTG